MSERPSSVLVTGAAGFIGSTLVERLLGGDVAGDLVVLERPHRQLRDVGELSESSWVSDRDGCHQLVLAAAQRPQLGLCVVGRAGLVQHAAVQHARLVAAHDDIFGVGGVHGLGLLPRQLLDDLLCCAAAGLHGGFVDAGRDGEERRAQPGEQAGAVGGGAGEDEAWHGPSPSSSPWQRAQAVRRRSTKWPGAARRHATT